MTKKILVVEDEGVVALDIKEILQTFGYDVIGIAATAEEAIERARKDKPDVIFMDINLKGRADGVDAAATIVSEQSIPIVFLTAHSDEATLVRARKVRPRGYILKPFEDNELRVAAELASALESPDDLAEEEVYPEALESPTGGTADEVVRFLQSLPLFRDVDMRQLHAVASASIVRSVDAHEYVLSEGTDQESGIVVISGRIAVTKFSDEAKELTVALLPPGDVFGLITAVKPLSGTLSFRAMLDSKVMLLPRRELEALLLNHPSAMAAANTELARKLSQAYNLASILAFARVEARILALLRMLIPHFSRGKDNSETRQIFLTRRELADLTGTTPETAIRVTKSLEREGLLDLARPGIIKIPSVKKLHEYADAKAA